MSINKNKCTEKGCTEKDVPKNEYMPYLKICKTCFEMRFELLEKKMNKSFFNIKIVNNISRDQENEIMLEDKTNAWIDEDTNLMWEVKQENNIAKKFTWNEAFEWVAYLNSIKYAGFTDWKIPTRYELESLSNVHYGFYDLKHKVWYKNNKDKVNNNYFIKKPLCQNTKGWYWTSEDAKEDKAQAYYVYFERGYSGWYDKLDKYELRCVRMV